jgi:hypothetical protein
MERQSRSLKMPRRRQSIEGASNLEARLPQSFNVNALRAILALVNLTVCAEAELTLSRRCCRQPNDPADGRLSCLDADLLDDWKGHAEVGAMGQQDVSVNNLTT